MIGRASKSSLTNRQQHGLPNSIRQLSGASSSERITPKTGRVSSPTLRLAALKRFFEGIYWPDILTVEAQVHSRQCTDHKAILITRFRTAGAIASTNEGHVYCVMGVSRSAFASKTTKRQIGRNGGFHRELT